MEMSTQNFETPEAALKWLVDRLGPALIGRVCGVSHSAVRQWKKVPSRAHAEKIARFMHGRVKARELYPEE